MISRSCAAEPCAKTDPNYFQALYARRGSKRQDFTILALSNQMGPILAQNVPKLKIYGTQKEAFNVKHLQNPYVRSVDGGLASIENVFFSARYRFLPKNSLSCIQGQTVRYARRMAALAAQRAEQN